jgi:hypothetical protein
MGNNRNSGSQQQRNWRQVADTIFLLGWRKFVLVVLLWVVTAVVTWVILGPPVTYLGLPGGEIADVIRETQSLGHRLGWVKDGRVGIVPTLIAILGTVIIPLYLLVVLGYVIVRRRPRSQYLRLNRYTLLLIPAFFLGIFLHNFVYAMFFPYFVHAGGDEGVFFLFSLIGIPLYLLIVLLNTFINFLSSK